MLISGKPLVAQSVVSGMQSATHSFAEYPPISLNDINYEPVGNVNAGKASASAALFLGPLYGGSLSAHSDPLSVDRAEDVSAAAQQSFIADRNLTINFLTSLRIELPLNSAHSGQSLFEYSGGYFAGVGGYISNGVRGSQPLSAGQSFSLIVSVSETNHPLGSNPKFEHPAGATAALVWSVDDAPLPGQTKPWRCQPPMG